MSDENVSRRAFALADPAATDAFGRRLAAQLRAGDVICLHGALGAGKTALARALIRAATGEPALEVPSPTFSLVQTYETAGFEIWHADLYRLESAAESVELGLDDAFGEAVVLLEWPERISGRLPADRLDITLEAVPDAPEARRIELIARQSWSERVASL